MRIQEQAPLCVEEFYNPQPYYSIVPAAWIKKTILAVQSTSNEKRASAPTL